MEDLDRERSSLPITKNEWLFAFINTFKYSTVPDATSIRKEVASVLGIGEATLARVVAEHNSGKNEKFSERNERLTGPRIWKFNIIGQSDSEDLEVEEIDD